MGGIARAQAIPEIVPQMDGSIWVYPTGERGNQFGHPFLKHVKTGPLPMTRDAYNVQLAILNNPNSMIVLKATGLDGAFKEFYMGTTPQEDGFVIAAPSPAVAPHNEPFICLQKYNYILTGETDPTTGKKTTLKGGRYMFMTPFSERSLGVRYGYYYYETSFKPLPSDPVAKITIKDLIIMETWGDVVEAFQLENPGNFGVKLDLSVLNVAFEKVSLPAALWRAVFMANVGEQRVSGCSFEVEGADYWSYAHALMCCPKVPGSTSIVENNRFKIGPAYVGSMGMVIALASPGAFASVRNNVVESANIGILMDNNMMSTLSITGNEINAWNCGIGGGNVDGYDLGVISNNLIHLAPEAEPFARVYSQNNKSICTPPACPVDLSSLDPSNKYGIWLSPYPTGILGMSTGFMTGGTGYMSRGVFQGNRFTGTMNRGVYLGLSAHDNIFQGNNMNGANFAGDNPTTYYFEANTTNNFVAGHTGGVQWVVNLNDSNHFTGSGFQGLGPGVGQMRDSILSNLIANFGAELGQLRNNEEFKNSLGWIGMG